jgi:hypothetical protein
VTDREAEARALLSTHPFQAEPTSIAGAARLETDRVHALAAELRRAEARGLRRASEYVRQVAPVGGYVLAELERFAKETEKAP